MDTPEDGAVPACPVCASTATAERFAVTSSETENGVSADAFRPSADRFGSALGMVALCNRCGHGFVVPLPSPEAVAAAYEGGADPVSLREEAGQVETARRDLQRLEHYVRPGRLCDLGCWTGSFLVAAHERGWETTGVELSQWASQRARARQLNVLTASIGDHLIGSGSCDAVVLCDVLEHAADPCDVVAEVRRILAPQGVCFITVPDAGSRLARLMGRRWWSVLPMHLQYFTKASLCRLLEQEGFSVQWSGTHAKVFSAQYYAERLGGYSSLLARLGTSTLRRLKLNKRLVAPDFRDRLALIAMKTPD
jgi:2-polyprenyl-3-methyl-5-hydroxy-6-metoxy-1,4-benzoquinol methylase